MTDNIIVLNQTTIHAWASGQYQKAIEHYFKLNNFTSEKMADGTRLHDEWKSHIIATKTLPTAFGAKPLNNPIPERKYVAQLLPWLKLFGTPDCIDSPIIYEFKSGTKSSEAYASSWQTRIYGVLVTYPGIYVENGKEYKHEGIYVEKAEIHHWNQYEQKHDMSQLWITDQVLKDTFNYIETIASEMHNYFDENDLWTRFGHLIRKGGETEHE